MNRWSRPKLNQWFKKLLFVGLCLSTLFQLVYAQNQSLVGADRLKLITVDTKLNTAEPAAGGESTLAIMMTPKKDWHGYWSNPGDAGFPTRFKWDLPKGVTIGEVEYPAPSQLVVSHLMNYIYHGQYVLLAPVTIDKSIAKGTNIPIKLDISYLACDPQMCLPEQQSLETDFTVGDGITDEKTSSQFNQWRQKLPKPLDVKGQFSVDKDVFTLSLPLPSSVDTDGAHIYPVINHSIANNTKQLFEHTGDTLRMQTKVGDKPGDLFEGVLVLRSGISLRFDANKTDKIQLIDKDNVVNSDADQANLAHTKTNTSNKESSNMGLLGLTAFLGAILGGLLLNIMPCVFPILSLKILSLSHQGSEKEAKKSAVAYTCGAVLVCVLLGGVILLLRGLGHQIGWAFQLQIPVVIAALILLMSAIGFNLAGLFEIGSLTTGSKLQAQKGLAGDFWTGVLAAFVATPCTGPFMAAALGAALVLPIGIAFLVFAGLGFGMALPFLIMGYVPKLRARIPAPGAWMITVRRLLSIPMFITVLGLVWVLMRQSNNDYVLSVLATLMLSTFGLWLTGLWQHSQHKGKWWPTILLTVLPFCALVAWVPNTPKPSQKIFSADSSVIAFDETKLNQLRLKQDVFVYFTADWCLTCQVNERTSIEREDVKTSFKKNNVMTMVGDWTSGDSVITEFLSRHGRSGVPLYLWYKKGVDQPAVLPQILSQSILIDRANKMKN